MAIRKDAGLAAVRLAHLIDEAFPKAAGPRSVWTMGRLDLEPGAPSIIPGKATMLFQFRDDEEATLKRLRKKGASVALEAANPAYETRIFGPDRVQIQGKLVGLFRRY